jgi:hypothetical protein
MNPGKKSFWKLVQKWRSSDCYSEPSMYVRVAQKCMEKINFQNVRGAGHKWMGNDAGRKSLYGVNSIGGDLDSAQSKKPKKNRKFGRILKKPILCKLVYIRQPKRLLFRHFCTKRFSKTIASSFTNGLSY